MLAIVAYFWEDDQMEMSLRCCWWDCDLRTKLEIDMSLRLSQYFLNSMSKQYCLCCPIYVILLSFTARKLRENCFCRNILKNKRTQCASENTKSNWYILSAGGIDLLSAKCLLMRIIQQAANILDNITEGRVWIFTERERFCRQFFILGIQNLSGLVFVVLFLN